MFKFHIMIFGTMKDDDTGLMAKKLNEGDV